MSRPERVQTLFHTTSAAIAEDIFELPKDREICGMKTKFLMR